MACRPRLVRRYGIDFTETLIGGSPACIKAVLNHPELEALPSTLDARLDCDGDAINQPMAEA